MDNKMESAIDNRNSVDFDYSFPRAYGNYVHRYRNPFLRYGFIGPFAGGLLGGLAAGALFGGYSGYGYGGYPYYDGYAYPPYYYGGYGYPYWRYS